MGNPQEQKPSGPVVPPNIISQPEPSNAGLELSPWGLRILKGIPKEEGSTIGIRSLAEKLNTLGDYSGYVGMVDDLVSNGYLIKNSDTNELLLTEKGRNEFPPLEK